MNNIKIDKLAKCVLPHSGETKTASSISKICHSGNETKCFAPVGRKVNSERNEHTLLQAPILFRQDAQFFYCFLMNSVKRTHTVHCLANSLFLDVNTQQGSAFFECFSSLKGSICFSPSFYRLSGFTFAAEWQKSPHRSWICFRSAVLSLPRALLSHICPINSSWSAAQAFCERL